MNPKTLFLLLMGLLCQLNVLATSTPSVYEQLCQLNQFWKNHQQVIDPQLHYAFANHEQLIKFHLSQVEKHLRQHPPANLTAEQRDNRLHCLDILRDYWQAGVFPKNTHHNITIPYFIDDYNTACAVGHLIRETGFEEVACKISEEMNYAYIAAMPYPEIPRWATQMGFEVAELQWIQPSYSPPIQILNSTIPADCGENNGNINISLIGDISVTGTPQWYKLNGNTIGYMGNDLSLQHKPSGLYKLSIPTQGMFNNVYDLIGIDNAGSLQVQATVTNETCADSRDGAIELSISGGTPPYQVRWYDQSGTFFTTGTNLDHLSSISSGIIMYENNVAQYTAEITDANGCKRFRQFNISYDNPYLSAYPMITNPTCGANDGVINLITDAGVTIDWSHNPSLHSNQANNLAAGTYTVTVTNSVGCQMITSAFLNNNNSQLDNLYPTATNDFCEQGIGTMTFPLIEGATYEWSHDPTLHSNQATNLDAGSYMVTIKLDNCQVIRNTLVLGETDVYIQSYNITNANSTTNTLGTMEVVPFTDNYTYKWSYAPDFSGNIATQIPVGMHTVTITNNDSHCSSITSFEIYDEVQLASGINENNFAIPTTLSVSPNELLVNYTYNDAEPLRLSIFDILGRSIVPPINSIQVGRQQQSFAIAHLPKGVYILQFSNGKSQQSIRWIK